MKHIVSNKKGILETLTVSGLVLIVTSACSPVKFSQGSKNEETRQSSAGVVASGVTDPGTSLPSSSGTGDPFDLVDPVTHQHFTFTSIDTPYQQTEFNPAMNDDDTVNFNFTNFTYASGGACSVKKTEYSYDPTIDNPGTFADLFPATSSSISLDQTKAACKAAEIASKIKSLAGGSCIPSTQNLTASENGRLVTIKMSTPKSGGDAAYILLEATFLQSPYSNNEPATISLDANCRCFYTFKRVDENSVNVMGLQEHCAAHFSNWRY
jgi:hypothetical protein